mmetsp:Transcript_62573/g.179995  ORF Transcript_62573/g.179995 Transcript_62573/m.179995 type:complete len:114 (+) Transcript_62573:148-489(+)
MPRNNFGGCWRKKPQWDGHCSCSPTSKTFRTRSQCPSSQKCWVFAMYKATSAKTGAGVAEGFVWLAAQFGVAGSSRGSAKVTVPHKTGPPSHAETETTVAETNDFGVAEDVKD